MNADADVTRPHAGIGALEQFLRAHFPKLHELARSATKVPSFRYCYHRRPDSLAPIAAFSKGIDADDAQLIDRAVASYVRRAELPSGQWADIFLDRHSDIHDAIVRNDRPRIEEILRKPVSSDLMFGFDSMARSLRRVHRIEDAHAPAMTLDALICLAEAIGARRIENPENYTWRTARTTTDEVVSQIEQAFQFQLPVPNPFPDEYGLVSRRGIMSYRVPQAIYQAWRVSQLVRGVSNPKVLEIGGGLGRTALYARHFGVSDYTIIDIPVSSLAQGYFLGRVVGDNAVQLHGEAPVGESANRIKILSPQSFLEGSERYDLVLNADSLTEIGQAAANEYWSAIRQRAKVLLSINHEANDVTVARLIKESTGVAHASRVPHWMRRGYAEEVVTFAH